MYSTKSYFQYYHLSIFILVTLLVSCNPKDKNSSVKETSNLVKSTEEIIKKGNKLKETVPVSFEEFSNWFPKTLKGMELQKISKGTLTGYGISGATATYQGSDKSRLVVNVNDGAGENGTMLTSQYITIKNMNTDETGSKSEKVLKSSTMIGVETVYKAEKKVLINFLYKDRFALNMQADNLEKQTAWNALEELDVDKLF